MSYTYEDFIASGSNFLLSDTSQYRVRGQDTPSPAPSPSFTIYLYQSSAEKNRVDKTSYLTETDQITGALRSECSIIKPVITFYREVQASSATAPRFNYVYIPKFNRYYFVDDLTSVNTQTWRMSLTCDVLMSYKTAITGLSAYVSRNQNTYNNLLNDVCQSFTEKSTATYLTPSVTPPLQFNTNYEQSAGVSYHRWVLTHFGSFTTSSSMPTKLRHYCNTNVKHVMTYQTVNVLTAALLDGSSSGFWQTLKNGNIWANDPTEAITSLRVYPFDIATWGAAGLASTAENFKIGSWDTPTNALGYYFDPSFAEVYPSFRWFDLTSYGTNFADYGDAVLLYLPFAGYIELNPADVYGARLKIELVVDYDTGYGSYNIYRYEDGANVRFITSKQAKLGIEVPISSTQATERSRNVTLAGISAGVVAAGLLTGGVGTAAAVSNEAITAGVSAAAVSTGSTALGNIAPNYTRVGGSETSALNGVYMPLEAFIKIVRKGRITRDYAAIKGLPLNQVKTLSDLTGYTEVASVHLEGNGFKPATETEKAQIEAQLKAGVIL